MTMTNKSISISHARLTLYICCVIGGSLGLIGLNAFINHKQLDSRLRVTPEQVHVIVSDVDKDIEEIKAILSAMIERLPPLPPGEH